VIGPAGVRVPVGEQQRPAVGRACGSEGVDGIARASVECEVVQPGPQPVMVIGGQRG
jgi:hypothetical protein